MAEDQQAKATPQSVLGGLSDARRIGYFGQHEAGLEALLRHEIEVLLASGRRVCIIDPIGVAAGIDGYDPTGGAPIRVVTFGGGQGRAFDPKNADLVGSIVASTRMNAIIDVSLLDQDRRMDAATIFLERLHRENSSALELFVTEASFLVPQSGRGTGPHRAFHPLIKIAVSTATAIRLSIASFSSANINQTLLSSLSVVAVLRVAAQKDRNAIRNSIAGGVTQEIVNGLGVLPDDHGWRWRHGHYESVARIVVPTPRTSAAGRPIAPLADLDLASIDQRLLALVDPEPDPEPQNRPAATPAAKGTADRPAPPPPTAEPGASSTPSEIGATGGHAGNIGSINLAIYDRHFQKKDATVMKAIGTGSAPREAIIVMVSKQISRKEAARIIDQLERQGHIVKTRGLYRLSRQAHQEFHMTDDMRSLHLTISKGDDPKVEGRRRRWNNARTEAVLADLERRGYVTERDGTYIDNLSDGDSK